jgi:hypothetical protein
MPAAPDGGHTPAWRSLAIRVWYGLLSVWALMMAGHGLFVMASGHAHTGEHFALVTVPAWKMLATGGTIVICWTAGRSVLAFQSLVVGWAAWLVSDQLWTAQPHDSSPLISGLATVAIWLMPVVLLRPRRKELFSFRPRMSPAILLSAAAAAPFIWYAVGQGHLAVDPGAADGVTYATTGLGVVLAFQTVHVALRPHSGRTALAYGVAACAAIVGLASVVWPHDFGGFGHLWGALVAAWGGVLMAVLWLSMRSVPRRTGASDKASTVGEDDELHPVAGAELGLDP